MIGLDGSVGSDRRLLSLSDPPTHLNHYLCEDTVIGAARRLHDLELKRSPKSFLLVWLFYRWQSARDAGVNVESDGETAFNSADCEEFQRLWFEVDCPALVQADSDRGVFFPFTGKYAYRSGATGWAVQSFYSQLQRPNQDVSRFVTKSNDSYVDADGRKVVRYSLHPSNDQAGVAVELLTHEVDGGGRVPQLPLNALALWRYRNSPIPSGSTTHDLVKLLVEELKLSPAEVDALFTDGDATDHEPLELCDEKFDAGDRLVAEFPDAEAGESLTEDSVDDASDGSSVDETRSPLARVAPTPDVLEGLLERFREATAAAGVSLDPSTEIAALSGILSSQFLLFAGPSGTGKSTLARALLSFFVPPDARGLVEARRQLIGPEDLVGFHSPITDSFMRGPDYGELLRLCGGVDSASPGLLVEEANLSPIEGYLAPITHGLSGIASKSVRWHVHSHRTEDPEGDESSESIPDHFDIQPYPRALATINVDSTAMAPSPKVAARACVLLLAPADAKESVKAAINALTVDVEPISFDSQAAQLLGDPLAALHLPETEQDAIESAVEDAVQLATELVGRAVASRRQLAQMAAYSAWFALLAQAHISLGGSMQPTSSPHEIAAENALLHFVLPSLSAPDFSRFVSAVAAPDQAPDPEVLSSLLGSRVRALVQDAGAFGEGALDFWDRLS